MSARTCCFCCDIKAGVLATAVYHSVKSLVGIIIFSQAVVALIAHTGSFFGPSLHAAALGYFLSLTIAFNIELVAGVCLIFGITQNKRELIISWIAANIFLFGGYIIMWLIGFALTTYDSAFMIINGVVGFVNLVIHAHALFVVYSYRKTLVESTESVENGIFSLQTFLSRMPWQIHRQPDQMTQPGTYAVQPQGWPPEQAQQVAPTQAWPAQPHPPQALSTTQQQVAAQQQPDQGTPPGAYTAQTQLWPAQQVVPTQAWPAQPHPPQALPATQQQVAAQQPPDQGTLPRAYTAQTQGWPAQQVAPTQAWPAQPQPPQAVPATEQQAAAQPQQWQFSPPPADGAAAAPPGPVGGPAWEAADLAGTKFAAEEGRSTSSKASETKARLRPSPENLFSGSKYSPLVDVSSDTEK